MRGKYRGPSPLRRSMTLRNGNIVETEFKPTRHNLRPHEKKVLKVKGGELLSKLLLPASLVSFIDKLISHYKDLEKAKNTIESIIELNDLIGEVKLAEILHDFINATGDDLLEVLHLLENPADAYDEFGAPDDEEEESDYDDSDLSEDAAELSNKKAKLVNAQVVAVLNTHQNNTVVGQERDDDEFEGMGVVEIAEIIEIANLAGAIVGCTSNSM